MIQADSTLRKAASALLHGHYRGTDGGAGYCFVNLVGETEVDAAVVVGKPPSKAAERALIQEPWRVWTVKRSYALDSCAVYESHMLRATMQQIADLRGETMIYAAYAEPDAVDQRTGYPLTGHVYMAAGFFYVGESAGGRSVLIDSQNKARSQRQGKLTLNAAQIRDLGWVRKKLGKARIWLAVVSPRTWSQRTAAQAWHNAWSALHAQRRAAARQWIEECTWWPLVRRNRAVSLGEPTPSSRGKPPFRFAHNGTIAARLQPALWEGAYLQRASAPVWVHFAWQRQLLSETDVAGETTAHRTFLPRETL